MFRKPKNDGSKTKFLSFSPSEIFTKKKESTSSSSEHSSSTSKRLQEKPQSQHPAITKTHSTETSQLKCTSSSSESSKRRSRSESSTVSRQFEQIVMTPASNSSSRFCRRTKPLVEVSRTKRCTEFILGNVTTQTATDSHPAITVTRTDIPCIEWDTVVFDIQAGGGAGENGTLSQVCIPGGGGGAGQWKKRVALVALLDDDEQTLVLSQHESIYLRILVGHGGSAKHSDTNRDGGDSQIFFGPTDRCLCVCYGGRGGAREKGGNGGPRVELDGHCANDTTRSMPYDGCSTRVSAQSQQSFPGGCGGSTNDSRGGNGGSNVRSASAGVNGSGGGGGVPNGALTNAGAGGNGVVTVTFHYIF